MRVKIQPTLHLYFFSGIYNEEYSTLSKGSFYPEHSAHK